MADLIKLTDNNGCSGTTMNSCQRLLWGAGVRHEVDTDGISLCSDQLIHAYENKYIAVLMNELHGSYHNYRMWKAKGGIVANEKGLKCGVKSLLITEEIPKEKIPVINVKDRVKILVLVNALYVSQNLNNSKEDFQFLRWSVKYLKDITARIPENFEYEGTDGKYVSMSYVRYTDDNISGALQTYARLLNGYNVANLILDYMLNDHGYAIQQILTMARYDGDRT